MWLFKFIFPLFIIYCNGGGGAGSSSSSESVGTWKVSGLLSYDYVPATSSGLDYSAIIQKPMRNIYVEVVRTVDQKVIATGPTDDNGNYSFEIPSIAQNNPIKLAVWAEMKSPSVIIKDNTSNNAKYVAYSDVYELNAEGETIIEEINAPSGWGVGNVYSTKRVAAPFAILDSIYSAVQKVKAVKPSISFPQLKVNWSTLNVATSGNISLGQIGTSHYNGETGELYILGKEGADTDEYDPHIIVHEWGHYFEDKLSRSDSGGGQHSEGETVEMSLAFSEGWSNALSAIVFDPDITLRDTSGFRQGTTGIIFSLETSTDIKPGWFSEVSNQQMIFDVYDSNADTGDTLSLGLGPILDVMTDYMKTTPAKTTIFSFVAGLKAANPSSVSALNTLTLNKQITNVADDFGTGETNNGGLARMLPVYNSLAINGSAVSVFMGGGIARMNEADNNRYYRFTATSASTKVSWTSTDTYIIRVMRLGKVIYETVEEATDASVLGPLYHMVTTTPGLEYVIQVSTHPDFVFNTSNPIKFSAQLN